MKRYERYSKYWYPHIITLLRLYPDNLGESEKGKEAKKVITEVIYETVTSVDGVDKIKAIDLVYFRKKKNAKGVALELYVSQRKVEKWLHDFIYEIAEKLGYS